MSSCLVRPDEVAFRPDTAAKDCGTGLGKSLDDDRQLL